MTENEKLRALLAEARKWVWVSHQAPEARVRSEGLRQRIDAALAEPVVDSASVRLQRVRDALLAAVPADGTIGNADDVSRVKLLVIRWIDAKQERDEALAKVAALAECLADVQGLMKTDARVYFKRGSEAMREAAALCVDDRLSDKLTDAAKRIRALPVPEDKP